MKTMQHKKHEKHPNIVAIFDKLYRVTIPTRQIQSIEEQRMFGTRAIGDRVLDNALINERTTTWISIDKMIDYFRDGVTVGIVDPQDCKRIYDAISPHLSHWIGHFQRGVNFSNAPVEDLILMDKFAATVYEHAKYHFTADLMTSGLSQKLSEFMPLNPMNFFKSGPVLTNKVKTGYEEDRLAHTFNPKEAQHESLADVFKRAAVKLRS